jgi:phosphopantothenoylcysteine decarboxylase/phosphopantothenate--cysteine ligase
VAGPAEGALAVGEGEGPGRMIEPWQIEEYVGRALSGKGSLTQKRVLVTAGPTREAVDPVRYLGNRSSGRMGFAIAQAAWRHGAAVTLVSGPTTLEIPVGVDLIPVESAVEMYDAVQGLVSSADVTVFAAAVADFRPLEAKAQKVKRAETGDSLTVPLVANPDVAADTMGLRKQGSFAVGFALETNDLLVNAQKKLEAKDFDLLVANDATEVGSGFEVPTNRVTFLSRDGAPEELPLMSKEAVAEELIERVLRGLDGKA